MDKSETELDKLINKLEVCPNCKSVVNGDKYCHNCGKYLLEDNSSIEEQTIKAESKTKSDTETKGEKKINTIQAMFIGIAVALLVFGIVIIVSIKTDTSVSSSSNGKLTYANYNKIQIGMSYSEVIKILGNYSSSENSIGLVYCFWLPTDKTGAVTDIVSICFKERKSV